MYFGTMKHIVLAGYADYEHQYKVENFVLSWKRVMSEHSDLVIICDKRNDVSDYLESIEGVTVLFRSRADTNPYLNRFKWFDETIEDYQWQDGQLIFIADIRDVIFQQNVFEKIEQLVGKQEKFIVCDEGIKNDEEWNQVMMIYSFPELYSTMATKNVYNCGVIAGHPKKVGSVCQQIFEKGKTAANTYFEYDMGSGLVIMDQAAYGILVHTTGLGQDAVIQHQKDDYCLTVATAPVTAKTLHVIDGKLCNFKKEPYYIVHQYDRIQGELNWDAEMNRFYHPAKTGAKFDLQIDCNAR